MAGERILIVDDNPANLKLARVLLHSAGYEVREAADAEQAVRMIQAYAPQLILMDIQLPGMDGLTLARQLKADPATRRIPIIALTAYAMKGDEERARAAGCDGYISKPIDTEALPRLVAEHLQRAAAPEEEAGPPTILLVEDNPSTRKLFRLTLEGEGYRVVEAPDAAAALSHVARVKPALVLVDLVLPDMSGADLAQRLRGMPNGDELLLIAMSGFPALAGESGVPFTGFDAVLVKPIEPPRLVEVVHNYLPEPRASRSAAPSPGKHILIADDDPVQLKLVALHLRQSGLRVTTASNGDAALELARSGAPDLVLSDVLMPGLDGFALCAQIRRDPRLADVPVVLTSAHYREQEDDELARRVGANAFLVRTPDIQELVRVVQSQLGARTPPPSTEPPALLEQAHHQRMIQQLERQAMANASMVRRCALQAAQLSILGGIADALARSDDVDSAITEILASCLDAGGISKGALYRVAEGGRLVLHHAIGFSEADRAGIETVFGYADVINRVVSSGVALSIRPVSDDPESALLPRLGVRSAVIVPLTGSGERVGALLLGTNVVDVAEADLLGFGRSMAAYIGQAMALASAFQRVNASERRYRALMESANDAIVVTTTDGKIVEVNRRGEQLFHIPADRMRGRHYADLVAPAAREHVARQTQALVAGGDARLDDVPVVQQGGGLAFTDWSAALVPANGNRLVFLIGRDVTERKRTEAMLKRRDDERRELLEREQAARREAERASRAKDEFLRTLSHELRTPLTAIVGWAALLRSKRNDPAWLDRAIATIERNAKAQTQLMDDLLDIARVTSGKIRLEAREIEVVPLIQAGLEAIAPMAEAKGVRVEADLDPEAGTMWGDPGRVQQIVWNLLTNGVKFTPRGGRVSVRLDRQCSGPAARTSSDHVGERLRIVVSDTGQGIRADFLSHVFERFRQADSSATRAHGGLGLGLSITHHLVALHQGEIRAESPGEGQGATFTVTFPVYGAARDAAPEDAPRAAASAESRGPTSPLDGLSVLLVEDETDTREMLAAVLQEAGARVTAVGSAEEALEAIERETPDVLLSDVCMPSMDGLALMRAIRRSSEERLRRLPAIALTACAGVEDRKDAQEAGFHAHVSKPVEPRALISAISGLSGRGRADP